MSSLLKSGQWLPHNINRSCEFVGGRPPLKQRAADVGVIDTIVVGAVGDYRALGRTPKIPHLVWTAGVMDCFPRLLKCTPPGWVPAFAGTTEVGNLGRFDFVDGPSALC